jgi:carbohydrate-binding DOMON domain-containing protein
MSKLTRTLVVGATLAAITLAGMTTVAHAYPLDPATDQPTSHHARRPPTQGQVGEAWHQHPVTSQQKTAQETAADATVGRMQARERFSIPNQTPAQVPAPAPAQPSGQPDWLVVSLGMLAAVLAVVAGLAVLAARRANRRARVGPAT